MKTRSATGIFRMILPEDIFRKAPRLVLTLYFVFKLLPMAVAAFSIYLGYRLFILGVTGQASLSVNAQTIGAQLVNAAPGLFFAIGGLTALIFSVVKGVDLRPTGDHAPEKGNGRIPRKALPTRKGRKK